MLLPQMLGELILPSIPRSLALRTTNDRAEIELKSLVDPVHCSFVPKTIGITFENSTTAESGALDVELGLRGHERNRHALGRWVLVPEGVIIIWVESSTRI
jgi:hypothetical protein